MFYIFQLNEKQHKTKKLKDDIEKLEIEKGKLKERIEENRSAVDPIKIQLEGKLESRRNVTKEKETLNNKETAGVTFFELFLKAFYFHISKIYNLDFITVCEQNLA